MHKYQVINKYVRKKMNKYILKFAKIKFQKKMSHLSNWLFFYLIHSEIT